MVQPAGHSFGAPPIKRNRLISAMYLVQALAFIGQVQNPVVINLCPAIRVALRKVVKSRGGLPTDFRHPGPKVGNLR